MKIMHVSHTDVRIDHRILRDLSVATNLGLDVFALGIAEAATNDKIRSIGSKRIVALPRSGFSGGRRSTRVESQPPPPVQISRPPGSLFARALFWLFLAVRIAFAIRRVRPDLVHVHDVIALPGAVIGKLFWKTKLVYDAHELHADKSGGTRFQGYLFSLVEKLSWRHLSGFVTVSDGIRDWYFGRYGDPYGVVVHNSIDERASLSSGSSRSREPLAATWSQSSTTSPRFIYVGALERGRGLETAIELFSDPCVRVPFAILGSGTLEIELRNKARGQSNIHFLKPVPNSDIPHVLQDFDYGWCVLEDVSLSDYLSLPNKLFEYLISGLVPICSNFPEMSRLIGEVGSGLIVNPADVREMRETVLQLLPLGRPKKRKLVAVEAYSWDAQAARLSGLYEEILDKPK